MSSITFLMYGIDKYKAKKHKYRISEATLLIFALLGGSLGALLGIKVFHHKTKHAKFIILVPIFLCIHIGILIYIIKGSF